MRSSKPLRNDCKPRPVGVEADAEGADFQITALMKRQIVFHGLVKYFPTGLVRPWDAVRVVGLGNSVAIRTSGGENGPDSRVWVSSFFRSPE